MRQLGSLLWASLFCSASTATQPSSGCSFPGSVPSGQTTAFEGGHLALPLGAGPFPLVMAFHGWGGSSSSGFNVGWQNHGLASGYAVLSLQGTAEDCAPASCPSSWSGFGSTSSPNGPDGAICESGFDACYPSCGRCADRCYWTTCVDSVARVVKSLDALEAAACIDSSRIYATGCSNGGMFTFELSRDERIASRLAGFVPVVGLPHNGFNLRPTSPANLLGFWGREDTTVPPLSDGALGDSSKTKATGDGGGWYYSSSRNTTNLWAESAGLDVREGRTDQTERWSAFAPSVDLMGLRCTGFEGDRVVECLFDGGHVCYMPFIQEIGWSFLQLHHAASATAPSSQSSPNHPTTVPSSSTTKLLTVDSPSSQAPEESSTVDSLSSRAPEEVATAMLGAVVMLGALAAAAL